MTFQKDFRMNTTWVYGGGYGVSQKEADKCRTSRNGPSPFKFCKFPFKVQVDFINFSNIFANFLKFLTRFQ